MSVRTHIRNGLLAAGCLALTSTAGAQVISQQNPGQTYSVFPTSGNNIPSVFTPGVDLQAERPNHPPIDQIPEMPMPDSAFYEYNPDAPWTMTFHDITTGETIELPERFDLSGLSSGQSPEGDFIGVDGIVEGEPFMGRGFGTMTLAGSLSSWPRSGNVKLVMRFVDTSGSDRWFVCSGSMGDAGVVVTAAHCVYARTATGPDIFDWAEEVYIYPAWDGVGSVAGGPDSDEVIQNFGWARGDAFLAGTDYVNNGNFDRDAGLIRINRGSSRNVGMLTGWFGWAWGSSCATIQGRNYHNFSYPAENCPTAGLHNGRDMYYWFGTFDSCPGNQLQLDTGGNCLDTVWGGMSGSGAYYISGDNRYTHAVCSNSNRTTRGRYCKLWEQFVLDMQDFETTTRGNTFDLELLRCRADGSTTVQAGTSMDDTMRVVVANATNNNPASNTYTLRVYLSTNNNISSADTLLATWNYNNVNFGAMSSLTFIIPAPNIPITTPAGTYWIGAILDSGTDGISSNNDTDTWDAQQVTVTLGVPATPTYISPSNGATGVDINDNLDWNTAARATSYDVYFGTDPTPDAGEFQGNTASSLWFLPALNYNTTYYWQIVARNSAGTTAGDVWSFTTEPAPFVDLSASDIFATRGTYYRGQTVDVDHRVTNVGTLASSGYDLDIRASLNQFISAGDVLMENLAYGPLNPGATRTVFNTPAQLPPTMAPGNYFIGTIVNSDEDTNSGNNWLSDTAFITVLACDADLAAPWGVLDFFDIQSFLNAFSANDPSADMNNDGAWDFFDVQIYLQAFSAGC